MKERYRFSICFVVSLTVIGLVVILVLSNLQVYRDWAFICENTASRKGYRYWFNGMETGYWYKESPLESFMREKHSDQLANRWTSYAGTGKNIFGVSMLFGHGRPGPILRLDDKVFADYFVSLSDQEKLELYVLFSTGDEKEISDKVTEIWEKVLDRRHEKTER